MRPEVAEFIERFELRARQSGQHRSKVGKSEIAFLENVWGPAFNYDFSGLEPEYLLKDFANGNRYADFVYIKNGIRLLIEIDGFHTHARDVTIKEFDDHLLRQNDLIMQGWIVLRFSPNLVEKHPMLCQSRIIQAIGYWWAQVNKNIALLDTEVWTYRKKLVSDLASRYNGVIRTSDIASYFNITNRTALKWANRFVSDGLLIPIQPNKRVIGYQIKGYVSGF